MGEMKSLVRKGRQRANGIAGAGSGENLGSGFGPSEAGRCKQHLAPSSGPHPSPAASPNTVEVAFPPIFPISSSHPDTASLILWRHRLATQLHVALVARLFRLAHDLLVRARCRLGCRQTCCRRARTFSAGRPPTQPCQLPCQLPLLLRSSCPAHRHSCHRRGHGR